AVPLGAPAAGAVDQDAPHGLGRGGKKVRAVLPGRLLVAAQAQPGLVHERRRLKRVPVGFAGHLRIGELAQLIIDKRQQLLGGLRITLPCAVQDDGDLMHEPRSITGWTESEARILGVFKYKYIAGVRRAAAAYTQCYCVTALSL